VFGVGETDTAMPDIARRYARSLALHRNDHVIPPNQHTSVHATTADAATATP